MVGKLLQILCSDKAKVFSQMSRALSLTFFITMHIMGKTHIFFGIFGQRNVLFCFVFILKSAVLSVWQLRP